MAVRFLRESVGYSPPVCPGLSLFPVAALRRACAGLVAGAPRALTLRAWVGGAVGSTHCSGKFVCHEVSQTGPRLVQNLEKACLTVAGKSCVVFSRTSVALAPVLF
eukprot:7638637-Pyramimonas_sp.AAC.1